MDSDGADDFKDVTEIDWYTLTAKSDLKKSLELFAEIDDYRKACEAHKIPSKTGENSNLTHLLRSCRTCFFVLENGDRQFSALGDERETYLDLCRRHDLCLIRKEGRGKYYNYVSGEFLEAYIAETFPGSADDAAAYGAVALRKIDINEEK